MSQGNDLISRDKAIELVVRICDDILTSCKSHYDEDLGEEVYDDIKEFNAVLKCNKDIRTALRKLQAEPRWIPCSERMPEESVWVGTKEFGTTISDMVHVTFENENGERFVKQICFQNGTLSRGDQRMIDVFFKGSKPIAWCPFPEPWKGNSDGV